MRVSDGTAPNRLEFFAPGLPPAEGYFDSEEAARASQPIARASEPLVFLMWFCANGANHPIEDLETFVACVKQETVPPERLCSE